MRGLPAIRFPPRDAPQSVTHVVGSCTLLESPRAFSLVPIVVFHQAEIFQAIVGHGILLVAHEQKPLQDLRPGSAGGAGGLKTSSSMELRKTVYLGVLYVLGKWVTFDWQVMNGIWDAQHGEEEMKMTPKALAGAPTEAELLQHTLWPEVSKL